jgi:mannan endo-1,4-beta-mannosidase
MKVRQLLFLVLCLVLAGSFGTTAFARTSANHVSDSENQQVQAEKGKAKKAEKTANLFVTRKGSQLMLGNKPFRFVGSNNYYMHYKDHAMIDSVINSASDMGVKVLRVWGFLDGNTDGSQTAMQYAMGKYMDDPDAPSNLTNGFSSLDYTIEKAKEKNIRIVVVLTNNWGDFGGMNKYVSWENQKLGTNTLTHDDFYTNTDIKNAYKAYVNHMLNHTNSLTGLAYKNDPTIMTWELANEPRNDSDKTGNTLLNWVQEMSGYIKSLDPHHLVAVGDEGFFNRQSGGFNGDGSWAYNGYSGVDWDRLIKVSTVDYGTFHMYPEGWGIKLENIDNWGKQYILDHLAAGKKAKKPVVLEEYGISGSSVYNRQMIYDDWNNTMLKNGGTGSMFWILTGIDDSSGADVNGNYPDYDGYRIIDDNSAVTNMLKQYAKAFDGPKVNEQPRAYMAFPAKSQDVKGNFTVKTKIMNVHEKVKSVNLKLGDQVVPMIYNKTFNDFEYSWDTTKAVEDSEVTLKATTTFANKRTVSTSPVTVTVNNVVSYDRIKTITFENDFDLNNISADQGTYQAGFGDTPYFSFENGMLRVNVNLPGAKTWEEVKVGLKGLPEIQQANRVSYDLLIPTGVTTDGSLQPYVALNPGWIKVGQGQSFKYNDLPEVKVGNGTYKAVHFQADYDPSSASQSTDLYIGIVGNMLQYKGPVYIDNVTLYTKH